ITAVDRIAEVTLTTVCPLDEEDSTGLTFTQEGTTDVYGLGEMFQRRGGTDGNWIGKRRLVLNLYGNELARFNGGNVGNAQFPIMYALGADSENYAFFLDDIYQHYWDFSSNPFTLKTTNDHVNGYIMTGPDLRDLRQDYMELTGRPPVPPRQMFGLWVSEFSYDDWQELSSVLESLEEAHFPVDGFVLDLAWFGGIGTHSQMGSLAWDEANFPDPAAFITSLRQDYGVGIMTVEESYVSDTLPDYEALKAQNILARSCENPACDPVHFNEWWGTGSMVDWTNPAAAAWWHEHRRQHLIDEGVIGHWTDLGEPENYNENAWYYGFPESDLHSHADIHNVYNLLWAKSIWDGYQQHNVEQRPFILSRSGTSGIQRYGVSMWSGDIDATMPSLEAQMNVQMHMALSGIDYFGSDVGGFNRDVFDPVLGVDKLYTVWLADSALTDVPLRPHVRNLQNQYQTAPSLVGDVASNLANVRLRYELIPYLYTLAHEAYRTGDAVIAPLVYYYQTDETVRSMGSQKMLGPSLMMAAVTGYALDTVNVYFPPGGWFDYYTHEYIESAGEWREIPTEVNGVLRVPLFVRDGAIVPQMIVDDQTMNSLGKRRDESTVADTVVSIYQNSAAEGEFTLIEDDGTTMAYQNGAIRETSIMYSTSEDVTTVRVSAASSTYDGAYDQRWVELRLVGDNQVADVLLNGETVPQVNAREDFSDTEPGWFADEVHTIYINAATSDVSTPLEFQLIGGA
ncbi:MAG: DUF5110 domain-containing protein, partial [Anaerolineae bacterium]|nr:DUF5110 domain-containing protein [Anaerolineae bacterium]